MHRRRSRIKVLRQEEDYMPSGKLMPPKNILNWQYFLNFILYKYFSNNVVIFHRIRRNFIKVK